MSKHSKHGRGKHSHFKRAQRLHQMQMNSTMQPNTGVMQSTTGAMQPSPGAMQTPSATPMTPRPAVTSPTLQASMQKRNASSAALPLHYEFISGDLKRIGILTVAILAILVVLYIFIK
jgi:hypothetical protein